MGGDRSTGGSSRRGVLRASAALGASFVTTSLTGCLARGPSPREQVEEHREALAAYTDVRAAISDGYRTTATFVQTGEGTLGEVFVDFEVSDVDPTNPHALLYTLTAEGAYEPLGCKWYVPADQADSAPSLFGMEFAGPYESDVPFLPRHYALHVWLFRDNPDGLFARYNPAVEPPAMLEDVRTARTALSSYSTGQEATAAGYRNTEQCVGTDRGAYGVPFVREGTASSGGLDLRQPPVLLYRVTENWSYVLLGAEWYVPVERERPSRFGKSFHDPRPAHSPKVDQPRHYGLHAWLFRANPRGLFEQCNPTVQC